MQTNTTNTTRSARDTRPSFVSSSRMSALPPGISFNLMGKITYVSRNHVIAQNTIANGTPISIHSPKPIVSP